VSAGANRQCAQLRRPRGTVRRSRAATSSCGAPDGAGGHHGGRASTET